VNARIFQIVFKILHYKNIQILQSNIFVGDLVISQFLNI